MQISKILLVTISLFPTLASTPFAALYITGETAIGSGSFTPSTQVGLMVVSEPLSYTVTSAHLFGTEQYGSGGGGFIRGGMVIYHAAIPPQTGTVGVPTSPTVATDLPPEVSWSN